MILIPFVFGGDMLFSEEYKTSKENQEQIFKNAIERDFRNQLRIALEIKDINFQIEKLTELLFLYPRQISVDENKKIILDLLLRNYSRIKNKEEFLEFLTSLKNRKIITQEDFEHYEKKVEEVFP